jgi:hypothetical protein
VAVFVAVFMAVYERGKSLKELDFFFHVPNFDCFYLFVEGTGSKLDKQPCGPTA